MTTTPTLSWGELWGVYRRSPAHMQTEILAQINLPDILKYSSRKVIKEVFEEAPDELKPHPQPVLDIVDAIYLKWGRKPPRRR